MSILKTPADLGNVIRQRRKTLGWDQAQLAQETGVSRQWIIDIEKGKPRAELQLVLRTLNVLGIELDASTRETPSPAKTEKPTVALPNIDHIVENSRTSLSYANTVAALQQLEKLARPQSAVDAAHEQMMKLTRPQSAADAAHEQMMKLTRPQSAVDAAHEQMMKLTRPQSAADAAYEQLKKLTRPQSAVDTVRELANSRSESRKEGKKKSSLTTKSNRTLGKEK